MSGTRRWESCRALGSFLRSLGKCSWHPGDVHETQASLDGAAEGRCAGGCLFERRCAPPASKASWVLDATCSIRANRSMKVALSWERSGMPRPELHMRAWHRRATAPASRSCSCMRCAGIRSGDMTCVMHGGDTRTDVMTSVMHRGEAHCRPCRRSIPRRKWLERTVSLAGPAAGSGRAFAQVALDFPGAGDFRQD